MEVNWIESLLVTVMLLSSNDADNINARSAIIVNAAKSKAILVTINREFPSLIQSIITSKDK